jgi:hypothetical protein
MKKLLTISALALAVFIANAQSVAKTSFTEVTSQLDPGGDFYLYLGTAQWLDHLSTKIEGWRSKLASFPDVTPENITNINKAFDIVERLVTDSGIEDASGLGLSSLEIEPGLYRNKALLHHYPGKGNGFLWKLCGGAPHALDGLDLCPANTAFAMFSDADLPLVWNVIQVETAKSGFPEAQQFLQQVPAQFEQATKMKWEDALHSLGGEFGLILTLDESNNVPIPLPSGLVQIPDPALLIAIKVNDDAIYNRIADQLKTQQGIIHYETNNVRMITQPLPMPLAINVRPTAAASGGWLFIASSDSAVAAALDVKSGTNTGLKSTAEFKHLAQGLPATGNQFSFMSTSFGRTLLQIQKQMMNAQSMRNGAQAQAKADFFNSLFTSQKPDSCYAVGQNRPDGCYTVGNNTQSFSKLALIPVVAVPAMLSAIAIPNFVKARSTSQQNACINNLRQIDAAKNEWALEKAKKEGDVPTEDDLKPYIRLPHGQSFLTCPAGGTYTINPLGTAPACSLPNHVLP